MNPIIYITGAMADGIGVVGMTELAKLAAELNRAPVDVLTYGPSVYHSATRITGTPTPPDTSWRPAEQG